MNTKYLLPHKFKFMGYVILFIGLFFAVWAFGFDEEADIILNMPALHNHLPFDDNNSGFMKIVKTSILDEISSIFIIIGALFIAFSKETEEDEYVMKIRLESLVWSVIVNSIILIFCIIAFYGSTFFICMTFNIVSVLLLFILKFKITLRQVRKYE